VAQFALEAGKPTELNLRSADQPEWFTEMDKNQDGFIQPTELDQDY
jgi:hypothetical protein